MNAALRWPVLFSLVLLAFCSSVDAHALLVGSSPRNGAVLRAAPKQALLRFDAKIEKSVTTVTLYDGKHSRVRLRRPLGGYTGGPPDRLIVPLPKLKPGAYQLEYRVMATDGHLTPGLIRFTVTGGKAP